MTLSISPLVANQQLTIPLRAFTYLGIPICSIQARRAITIIDLPWYCPRLRVPRSSSTRRQAGQDPCTTHGYYQRAQHRPASTRVPPGEAYFCCPSHRSWTHIHASIMNSMPGTVSVYVSSVRKAHLENGFAGPLVDAWPLKRVMKGIQRCHGTAVPTPCLPITMPILRHLMDARRKSSILNGHDKLLYQAAMLLAFFGLLMASHGAALAALVMDTYNSSCFHPRRTHSVKALLVTLACLYRRTARSVPWLATHFTLVARDLEGPGTTFFRTLEQTAANQAVIHSNSTVSCR